jgi:uncharacterized OsmC-like protein
MISGGQAKAIANQAEISFDATSGRATNLANPAELLLTSLAACMLKNIHRYSEILHLPYPKAKFSISGTRSDRHVGYCPEEELVKILEQKQVQN